MLGDIDALRVSSTARYTGSSFSPPVGDFSSDASTLLLYNFNDPPGSMTVTDSGPNGWTGTLGVGFAGATSPGIVSVSGTCRYIQTTGSATAQSSPDGEITIETFDKPILPRRGTRIHSPQVMQTVHVTIPSGFTEAQTTVMLADSLNDQLSSSYTAAVISSNIVALHFTGPFTMNVIDAVPGQTVEEIPEPAAPPIPTLSEWGITSVAAILAILGILALRCRRPCSLTR
jgi:hypothetical protein